MDLEEQYLDCCFQHCLRCTYLEVEASSCCRGIGAEEARRPSFVVCCLVGTRRSFAASRLHRNSGHSNSSVDCAGTGNLLDFESSKACFHPMAMEEPAGIDSLEAEVGTLPWHFATADTSVARLPACCSTAA